LFLQAYEINDSELAASFRAIDISLEPFISRSNVDPTSLPWKSLKVLLTESIYGGKLGESDVSFNSFFFSFPFGSDATLPLLPSF